jgi:hypothetical protein
MREIVTAVIVGFLSAFVGYQIADHEVKTHVAVKVFAYDTPGGFNFFGKCADLGAAAACATLDDGWSKAVMPARGAAHASYEITKDDVTCDLPNIYWHPTPAAAHSLNPIDSMIFCGLDVESLIPPQPNGPHPCSEKEIGNFPHEPGWRGLCE